MGKVSRLPTDGSIETGSERPNLNGKSIGISRNIDQLMPKTADGVNQFSQDSKTDEADARYRCFVLCLNQRNIYLRSYPAVYLAK